ncbi:MAG: hypothetical protein Kilf2KO_33730 [Rhodospirillales bacterium]
MSIAIPKTEPAPRVMPFRAARPGKAGLSCLVALPPVISQSNAPLVAVHGIRRAAGDQVACFAARAATQGRPVIAPLFDSETWPRYQQVVRGKRADLALIALLEALRDAGIWRTETVQIAGYSGGAQFAHRFALLHPHLVSRLSVASAGWFTFPDDAVFPYGFGRRPEPARKDWGQLMAGGLDRFLTLPIQVAVGSKDNRADRNTRQGVEIDAQQGADRTTRAKRWVAALRTAAFARGLTTRIGLVVLPGCGHDFRRCVTKGGLDRLVLPDLASGAGALQAAPYDQALAA